MNDLSSVYKIMVVDDDKELNILIRNILGKEGYKVHTTESGTEALNIIKKDRDFLVLLDYKLPDMDAFEFIRQVSDEKFSVPVVIMTGVDDLRVAVNIMKAGARDYLVKDINFLDILLPVINKIIHDIENENKLLKTEKTLEDSEKKIVDLMEAVPIGILITDLKGRALGMNSKILEIFKFDSKEEAFEANSIQHYVDINDRIKYLENLKAGNTASFEGRLKRKDGSVIWALINSIIRKNENGEAEFISSIQDITAKKKEEEDARLKELQLLQTEKMASIGILLSGIVHEINNPNNYILLNSNIIKDFFIEIEPVIESYYKKDNGRTLYGLQYDEFIAEIKKIIDGLIEGSNKIQNIIQNIKEFIKPDLGRLDNAIDINKIIESSITITNNIIKKSTNKFIVDYEADLPLISGNTQQLEQVIINLIVNSCESLNGRDKMIKITTALNKNKNSIIVNVIDEGVGIPVKNLNKITEPFFTTKSDRGGTGLGLSISYNIIKKFNGDLTFTSEPGKGTTATIILPINK